MKKINTVVADDEPLARARILKLLEQFEEINIVGECKNGSEALRCISDYKPDLIFLDIQMPDFDGFEVLAKSHPESLPFIIFVTAFDQYALKAFDVHAVDYLLKPYDDERFTLALEHAKAQIKVKQDARLHQKIQKIFDEHNRPVSGVIEVKDRLKSIQLNPLDIYYIESEGNYLKIHLKEKSYLHRQTLHSIVDILPDFLRVHRSLLLNPNYISSVKYAGNNQYNFLMKNKERLLSSRSYKKNILQYLEDV